MSLATHWFRVGRLTPHLRAHAQVHRHVARGQIWYVLQDHQTGRFFRISPAANLMLCLMDGRRSMEDIWRRVADKLGAARPTQDETVRLMIQLHQSDLLRTGLPPDMTELGRRADKFDAGQRFAWFTSPMAMRFRLGDPDRFLTASLPFVHGLFTRTGFVAWLLLMLCGVVLAVLHWPEITANVSDRVFTTYNVLMLVLLYPASKTLHELGHAYMTKASHRSGAGRAGVAAAGYPLPYAQVVEGVVWVPDEAVVHAAADDFVADILVPPDNQVVPGQVVIALRDPVADTQVEVFRAQVTVAEDRFNAVNLIDLAQARLAAEQVTRARAALDRAEGRARDLNVVAQRGGRFVVPDAARLPGSFVHKGDVLGYVIGGGDVAVLAVVPQAEIDLVRHRTIGVALRFTEAAGRTVPAEIVRETPSALERPPAAALSSDGGGPMPLDPTSRNRDRPLDRWYELVVRPTGGDPLYRIGSHTYARFDLGAEPIAWRLLRHMRQVVLRSLNV